MDCRLDGFIVITYGNELPSRESLIVLDDLGREFQVSSHNMFDLAEAYNRLHV